MPMLPPNIEVQSVPVLSALTILPLPLLLLLQLDVDDEDADAASNGGGAVRPTPLGRVASFYYLQHTTAGLMAEQFRGQQVDHTEVG